MERSVAAGLFDGAGLTDACATYAVKSVSPHPRRRRLGAGFSRLGTTQCRCVNAAQLPENAMQPAFGNLNKGMAALAEGAEKEGRACGKCLKRPWRCVS